ncbi:hypothetical protein PVOR_07915 [Paenibacillus vortex V453]|uniref:Uncharacterized protein n=1 Tax=Paenibacillus vortex V453 TaxID=715225 RepID=A0A2R9SXZ6_9BACL|nr:hypothetical protein PVOR_07915 [Paenibacillus vortex V453]
MYKTTYRIYDGNVIHPNDKEENVYDPVEVSVIRQNHPAKYDCSPESQHSS